MKPLGGDTRKSLIEVHLSVLLFGISGLFPKWIALPAAVVAFGRVFFSVLFLFLLMRIRKEPMQIAHRNDWFWLAGAGSFLAVHWISFIQSIQISTVAIGTITFATYPLFVTFLEPVLFRERLRVSQVLTAVVMLAGVAVLVPLDNLGGEALQGVLLGMLSSATYGVFSLMNRRLVKTNPPLKVAFYEQCVAALLLSSSLFVLRPAVTIREVSLLVLMGIFCTAMPHALFISGLRRVKAQTAGVIAGLESVYSIVAAFLLLGENPGIRAIIGGVIVLSAVVFSSLRSGRASKEAGEKSLQHAGNSL